MTLTPREREVLDAVSRTEAVGLSVLAQHFENRFPGDELDAVCARLVQARLVTMAPGRRTFILAITREGRRAVEEGRRG